MNLPLALGVILFAGALAAWLADKLRIPKVTVMILLGLALGPSALNWINEDMADSMHAISELALALVLFDLGSQFALRDFGKVFRRVGLISVCELVTTFVLVGAGLTLLGVSWEKAWLLGVLALATAPATTILVMREYDSEGPITNYTYALVALNNLVAIVAFQLLFFVVLLVTGEGSGHLGGLVFDITRTLAGAMAIGVIGGLILGLAATHLESKQTALLFFALMASSLGLCHVLEVSYLLTFLAMGLTVANATENVRQMFSRLDQVGVLLYVVFFVTAGTHLKLDKLWAAGIVGAGYIGFRVLGKYLGIQLAMLKRREEPKPVRIWLGLTLMAQAGAAIGLAQVAKAQVPGMGGEIYNIILGTVVFFEVVGPLLISQAVVRGGEVPLAHVVHPHGPTLGESLRNTWDSLRQAFGFDPYVKRPMPAMTVGHLMRRNVQSLPSNATFLEVIEYIEKSRYNTYPVVGPEQELLGVIYYPSIRTAVFDPGVANLVLATDVTVPARQVLRPDEPLEDALALFEKGNPDMIPVISDDGTSKLIGVVERRDVLRFAKKRHLDSNGDSEGSSTNLTPPATPSNQPDETWGDRVDKADREQEAAQAADNDADRPADDQPAKP